MQQRFLKYFINPGIKEYFNQMNTKRSWLVFNQPGQFRYDLILK